MRIKITPKNEMPSFFSFGEALFEAPSAFVDAGGGFGGGFGGMFPPRGGAEEVVAGWDVGGGPEPDILVCLYFTEEFQSRQSNIFFGHYCCCLWRRRFCARAR